MRYIFNEFVLDTDRFELSKNSRPLQAQPQVIELLVVLIENRERMVSKEELNELVWKGRVVSEATLSSRIKMARQLVGDDGRKQEVIRTIHKKGFCFVAQVEVQNQQPVANKENNNNLVEPGKVVDQSPGSEHSISKPIIAVLPFTNLSDDSEQEYFSDGITEDIIAGLSKFTTLFVMDRHSSLTLLGEQIGIKEVSEKHGVDYVIQGSVRWFGEKVRVTAQLIEAQSGSHIWTDRYDRDLEDILATQDEVTQQIVAVLPGWIQEDIAERASRKQTDNIKAYELMLQGKSLRDRFTADSTAQARELYEKAIALDPRYARAHMYLADTYVVDIWLGLNTPDASSLSLKYARKAVALDNYDVYLKDQLGFAYLCEGMWEDAEIQFDKTLSRIVNEAESMAWCGYAFTLLGQHEKARGIVFEAMRLDPSHRPFYYYILGQVYYFWERYDDVIKVLTGEALLNSLAMTFLVGAFSHLGRNDEAQSALTSFIAERHSELDSRNMVPSEDTINVLAGGYRTMWKRQLDWDHIADGLRKAGLPD